MDIYEYAMKMEKDGEGYYHELQGRTANQGLKAILGMLIDAELRHYNLFQNMKLHQKVSVPDDPLLGEVKNIFEQMRDRKDFTVDVSQRELYMKARDIEAKSRAFYLEQAGTVSDPSQREAFEKIAAEEQRHYVIVENILNFISRPETWLENAEWYEMEED